MEQRPLRLGDIVDDYCPRERRITNHVIVALVGDSIRQTRCSTCDTEHVFKAARLPRRKKKDDTAALYDQVLADAGGGQLVQPQAMDDDQPDGPTDPAAETTPRAAAAVDPPAPTDPDDREDTDDRIEEPANGHEVWSAHRRLIRATLPRTGDEPPTPRPIPEFTMHQRPAHRAQPFRYGYNNGGQGGGHQGGHSRHGGGRHGGRHGGGDANGNGNGNGNGNTAAAPSGRRSGRHRGGKHRGPR